MMNIFGTILKFIIASTNHSNMSERFKVLVFEAIYVLVQTLNKIVAGEVSLPGGKAEEHDKDDGITATREAEEEIGLDPSLVDVVAFLEPFLSQHLLRVIPVVGILWDRKAFNPTPNPAEVEAVLDAPFEMFLKDENRRSEEFDWMGEKHLVHFFDYKTGDSDYVIWGLTARILIRAATVVYQRPPAFIEQKPNLKYSKMVGSCSIVLS
jgi:8-oxo-dGTP pyrophosphatase MutT (NUDIX family)